MSEKLIATDLWVLQAQETISQQQAEIDRLKGQHNADDKRIQQLLAVIEKQRQALDWIADNDDSSYYVCEKRAKEALAIKPQDVELVEVGTVCFEDTLVGVDLTNPTVKHGDTVYTIKTKE